MIASDVAAAAAAGRVPDGVSLEYLSEDKSRRYGIAIVCVTVLTFIIVTLRISSRLFILRRFGLDDGLATVSLILLVPFSVLCCLLMAHGSGRHYDYVLYVAAPSDIRLNETLDFCAQIVYMTCLLLCRLSGLAFYHRIVGVHPAFLRTIWAFAIAVGACFLVQLCLIVFHCRPVTSLFPYPWEDNFDKYTCLDWGVVHSIISALSLFCDVGLFGIPVAVLCILTMSRRRKIQLAGILLPGVLVIGISIGRVVLVVDNQWDDDQSWEYDPLLIAQVSEMGGTLIALSIPGLKPLWDRWVSREKVDSSGASDVESGDIRRQSSAGLGQARSRSSERRRDSIGYEISQFNSTGAPMSGTTCQDSSRGSMDGTVSTKGEKSGT